jgi:hypothetical protein
MMLSKMFPLSPAAKTPIRNEKLRKEEEALDERRFMETAQKVLEHSMLEHEAKYKLGPCGANATVAP